MNKKNNTPKTGLVSTDGFFQLLSTLNSKNMQYAGNSVTELRTLLREKENLEQYEQCAIIRDEILKRLA